MARFVVSGKKGRVVLATRIRKGNRPSSSLIKKELGVRKFKIVEARSGQMAIQKFIGKRFRLGKRVI